MPESEPLLKNRFIELSRRAMSRECYIYSEFLTTAEQDTLNRTDFSGDFAPFCLKGGYGAAERKIACFGGESFFGFAEDPPIACVRISQVSGKFAQTLTHRDFLGSLMALGLRRSVLGDIILKDNSAYLFCLVSVSGYIIEQLEKVKNTAVNCSLSEAPESIAELPEPSKLNVASERLDAVISAVYRLSRSESRELFEQGKVFVNSRLIENESYSPAPGCAISVRGFGRFIYEGIESETKKGHLRILVRIL